MSKLESKESIPPLEFIQQQKIIRMTVASAGGYGDQVACLHSIGWLKSIGFMGQVEIIYSKIIYKLVKLLGIEDQFNYGVRFELPNEKIVLIPIDMFSAQRNHSEPVGLFIAPTVSSSHIWGAAGKVSILEKMFKAHYAVIFHHTPLLGPKQAIHFPIPTLLEAARFLDDPNKNFLLTRKPGLPALMQIIAKKRVKTWSLYGLSTEFEDINAALIIKMLRSIAQQLNREDLVKGPIVLLLHNELSRRDLSYLSGDILCMDIRDPLFEFKINQIQPDEVLIVNLGALPTIIFEAIVRESFFPPLAEGVNFESMMLELGRLYLDCGFNGAISDSYLQKFMLAKNQNSALHHLVEASGQLCMPQIGSTPALMQAISAFVRNSLDPHSSLRHLMANISSDYHAPGNDRYLNSIITRLAKPPTQVFTNDVTLQERYHYKGSCDKGGISILCFYGDPSEIADCILSGKFNLTEHFVNQFRNIKQPVFFNLLANLAHNRSGLPRIISTYLEKNPQLCSILTKSETCADKMRDLTLAGNAQNIKAVLEYCRPELRDMRLQDIISEFCHEPLFYAALAPAQQTAHKVVQYLTFNLTIASHLSLPPAIRSQTSTGPVSTSAHLLLALSSMLIMIILAVGLFRGGAGLVQTAKTSRYWLWGGRRPPSQNNSNHSKIESNMNNL